MLSPGRVSLLLAGVLSVALILRVAAAVVVQQRLPAGQICLIAGDAEGYWLLGQQLAQGRDYAIYDPPRYVLRMPGFPLLLAACQRVFGDNLLAIRIVLACLGTAACGLVFWLGRELCDPRTGLVAAALTAVWPTMVLFSVLFLSETLFAAAMLASLIPLAKLLRLLSQPDSATGLAVWSVATGLLMGIATLVRPTWLLVGLAAPLVAMAAGRWSRPALVSGALLLLGLAISLAPWTIRNRIATGHFVVTTLWSGPSLYDGFNPQADGGSHMEFIERDGIYRRMTEYDADRHYGRKAQEYALAHPGRVLELALLKQARYWSPWPNASQFQQPLPAVGLSVLSITAAVLAAIGVWRHRSNVLTWSLPLAPILYFGAIHAVFVGSLRYRLPAEYPLQILVAAGALGVASRISHLKSQISDSDQKGPQISLIGTERN